MTVDSIMSFRLVKLKPTDRVCDALKIMHERQIRNLPVVEEDGEFVGLFGIRPLVRLLMPKAGTIKFGLKDLSFMPDEVGELYDRMEKISQKPVVDFLEKKKHLMFCKPSTTFPEVLELLDQSTDTSLPVIVLKGKHKRLVGMVSAWDVLEKLVINMMVNGDNGKLKTICDDPDRKAAKGHDEGPADENDTGDDPDRDAG